ncbi:MAG: N-acetylmuramoyl-L-alanine amidase [Verrucomicrobiota bacterium]
MPGSLPPVCFLAAFGALLFFPSGCSAPPGDGGEGITSSRIGVSLTRDAWGHRPGPRGFKTVIIDAGHGGPDSGAKSATTGDMEKHLALDTALRLASKLQGRFRTILLRSDDHFIELDDRVAMSNRHEGAILVSIHYNWSSRKSVRGPETYYWRVDSHSLAKRMQQAMEGAISDRSGNLGLRRRRLRLTRNPEIPCVLLELGYLSNPSEALLCQNPDHRDRLASVIARAIKDQADGGDEGMGPLPQPLNQPLSRPTDPPGS